jgi:ABC-type methionine transport system permease subunit
MSAFAMAQGLAVTVGAMLGFVLFRELSKHGYSLTDPATRRTAWTIIAIYSALWFLVVFVTLAKFANSMVR